MDIMTANEINQAYTDYWNSIEEEINGIAADLANKHQISLEQAEKVSIDVWYLRTRSRWTQELENQLVLDSIKGFFHNMNEYP